MILALENGLKSPRIAPPVKRIAWRDGAHRVNCVCATCGAEFARYASAVRKRNYCSEPCRRTGMAGASNPKWRGGLQSVVCEHCCTPFEIQRHEIGNGRGHFCSIRCKAASQSHDADVSTSAVERQRAKGRRYRVRKSGCSGSHSEKDWLALCSRSRGRCAKCGQKRALTRDHIIPLAIGGTDDITNIQPLCRSCNSAKGARRVQLL